MSQVVADNWLSIDDIQERYIAFSSRNQIGRLAKQCKWRHQRIGRKLYYHADDVAYPHREPTRGQILAMLYLGLSNMPENYYMCAHFLRTRKGIKSAKYYRVDGFHTTVMRYEKESNMYYALVVIGEEIKLAKFTDKQVKKVNIQKMLSETVIELTNAATPEQDFG